MKERNDHDDGAAAAGMDVCMYEPVFFERCSAGDEWIVARVECERGEEQVDGDAHHLPCKAHHITSDQMNDPIAYVYRRMNSPVSPMKEGSE